MCESSDTKNSASSAGGLPEATLCVTSGMRSIQQEPLPSLMDRNLQQRIMEASEWGFGTLTLDKLLIQNAVEMGMIQMYRRKVKEQTDKELSRFKAKKISIQKNAAASVIKKIL